MDNIPTLGTASDLEMRAARIADPGVDLKTKLAVANELREMIDTVRDAETGRVLPHMIPVLLDLLRSGEVAFTRDAPEYQFRRTLHEILHRIPLGDFLRPHAPSLLNGLLYLLRNENEENGVTCCRTIMDLIRVFRSMSEDFLTELTSIVQDVFRNSTGLAHEILSQDSEPLDPNHILPSTRSFKVLAEVSMILVAMGQTRFPAVITMIQSCLPLTFEVLALESPVQKQTREDYEAMGGYWAGMAPGIKNAQAYTDLISAQTKMISYSAFIMRVLGNEQFDLHGESLLLTAVRLAQDCPFTAITARRDLIMVLKHLGTLPYRRALVPHLDKLFDERVLLGDSFGVRETLRPTVYIFLADLALSLRTELTANQIARSVSMVSLLIHNPALSPNVHAAYARVLFSFVEPIITKDTPQGAAKVLTAMFESCLDRMETMITNHEEAQARAEKVKNGETLPVDHLLIERSRPISGAVYATEKPEEIQRESCGLFKTLIHGFRACLQGLNKCDGAALDGTLVARLFEGFVKGMGLFEDPRESTEPMEWVVLVLVEVNPHVFQEVWTQKFPFYFEYSQKRPLVLQISQGLFGREVQSPTLVAITMRFLLDRLPVLGEYDETAAAVTVRLYKMTFGAVTLYSPINEPLLAAHLGQLIMDCFPLAAKARKPTNYYHLLRGLFRAIGGGAGKFELLYQQVLPLLPAMLESLNRQLSAAEGQARDMLIELCLTVPLRLTHLIPHLSYLMHPLALALRGTPDLAAQGLRTLELCIDNLNQDFLDPTMGSVLRPLMEALHTHLRPVPYSHMLAHTTVRLIGKLGGRNRRLLTKEPSFQWHHYAEPASVSLSFSGRSQNVALSPLTTLALRTIRKADAPYRNHAYDILEQSLFILLHEDIPGRSAEELFVEILEGIYDAVHMPDFTERAEKCARSTSLYVFRKETQRVLSRDMGNRRHPSALLTCYLDALPHALARGNASEAAKAQELVSTVIRDLVALEMDQPMAQDDIERILHQLANRFTALCLEDTWVRKNAGCSGIKIMTDIPDFGVRWISERQVDLVRTLLHVLKDLPSDLPRDVDRVIDVLLRVLRVSNPDLTATSSGDVASNRNKILLHLTSIFFSEIQNSNAVVRRAAQTCIELLAELSEKRIVDLLMPHRDRTLTSIYTKPLRALPLSIQIGMIEAMRYCISLEPPLPDLNEELLRLLHETLALADADDVSLVGRTNVRQSTLDVIRLRVAAIKLLTASMPLTDFFSKQHQTRQRVTSVYFKSLYSPHSEVKEVAHEGLRTVLAHQSRLPKELLQTGLRPILMNLADPKRLSVPGLEGLARLLELLTNYFKVEIGHKLLDHFRVVADPQMLQQSSKLPLADNEGITKLVRLANIFHLLPSSANIFLDNLVNAIVQTEAQMHCSGQSPFSQPLAKYLDRYPIEAIDFFVRHLQFPRHVRTLRTILQARLAPKLQRELVSRTSNLVTLCIKENDNGLLLPGLQIFSDLAALSHEWIQDNPCVIDALVSVWNSELSGVNQSNAISTDALHRLSMILSIFRIATESTLRIDLLPHIVSVYGRDLPIDLTNLTLFLYRKVALSDDTFYRRNVLLQFFLWFRDHTVRWSHKAYYMRLIVTPMLLVHATSSPSKTGLLDPDLTHKCLIRIWNPTVDDATSSAYTDADDMLKVELLHFSTIMVQHYRDLVEPVKKYIIQYAWNNITSEDSIVKYTAYLLAARFFEAFETPQKFILRAWTGLLKTPTSEAKNLIRQALDVLAPILPRSSGNEAGYPQWAKTTRRLLVEENTGVAQIVMIYSLIARHSQLFYPVRALFVSHMVNCLTKLGLSGASSEESRLASVDMLQVIFDWEQRAASEMATEPSREAASKNGVFWVTPLGFRETMVSYLVRLATAVGLDPRTKVVLVPRALSLLRVMVGPDGWNEVTVKLNYFSRALEQTELNNDAAISQALNSAKVLHVLSMDKDDSWFKSNASALEKLVRKGLICDESILQDALHPVFHRLVRLYPLPKEEDEQEGDMNEFHQFIYSTINEGLRNNTALRGTLLMLRSVVQVTPERIEAFSPPLSKLLTKLTKDHGQPSAIPAGAFENNVRLLMCALEICVAGIQFLGDQRKQFLQALVFLAEKSKHSAVCRYILDVARDWALHRRDLYPSMKEKATLLQRMVAFEMRGELAQNYLELIYEIYTDPSLRRSDLTTRLENSFLLGCRARDPALRERFVDLLDSSIPRSLPSRLAYVLGVQNWEALADCNWIYLALHLLLGTVDGDLLLVDKRDGLLESVTTGDLVQPIRVQHVVLPIQRLLSASADTAHETWISVFPAIWSSLSRREQVDMTNYMVALLSKDYHIKQAELRPNVIQTLLTGIHACHPPMVLPPHLIKYLAKTFGAWHVGLEILQNSLEHTREDEPTVRDAVHDSLADLYAELSEDDMFYGIWRKRCLHHDTNVSLAFEQNGMWDPASNTYENALKETRAGNIPFSEPEYCLWEDHWMLAQEKLQQWDILYDLAKSESNPELQLEAAWRIKNWQEDQDSLEELIKSLPEVATPRRRVYEAFMVLLKNKTQHEKAAEFSRILEDAMQLCLRKWAALPPQLSAAHIPLLQHFQQFVELQEAVSIFGSLASTTHQNLEKKSSDLKMVLQAWRDRLPDRCDDISIWSDLVAWRQNVFEAINKHYIPLITNSSQAGSSSAGSANTFGYRGYHETAWIINRFAHIARKHELLEVCFTFLNRIYTLPNIEISEAFLKLREQARCHYQKPNDLQAGLEVINNTNLMYFSISQKAEFYTLKGMFHARAGRSEDANAAFGSAVQLDMNQAKAWAEWGKFNDRMFKDMPTDMHLAANAVSCYLQAAGLYKNYKSRPLLARVLWLLSVDDGNMQVARAFDTYKGDAVYWYWIGLIPQLCLSISRREVKQARFILLNIAKLFPQALFFHLRTAKEEMVFARRSAAMRAASVASGSVTSAQSPANHEDTKRAESEQAAQDGNANGLSDPKAVPGTPVAASKVPVPLPVGVDGVHSPAGDAHRSATSGPELAALPYRQSWEYLEEIVSILKTAFPLLVLSLETLVDQINQRFKPAGDEEIYRGIYMLLNDATSSYAGKLMNNDDDSQISSAHLTRIAQNLPPVIKKELEEEFLKSKMGFLEYIRRLQVWRERYEKYLVSRPRVQSLDMLSHYLTEFQYGRFDEIEVPGQYTDDKDNNLNFVKIQKFGPRYENCHSHGSCWKRITIHGSDGSTVTFAVQQPLRFARREERSMQLLRSFNGTLSRKKESRKRNLTFHLPPVVPCSAVVRMIQNDASYISLGDIYHQYCNEAGILREDPITIVGEKVKSALRDYGAQSVDKTVIYNLKLEAQQEIRAKVIPEDILSRYMVRTMDGPGELWRMRKQFALQLAAISFMTFALFLTSRNPPRFNLSRSTGLIAMSDVFSGMAPDIPLLYSGDLVPFRLTANLQHFLRPMLEEAILAPAILAIGRALTEAEAELGQRLSLFIRDEIMFWLQTHGRRMDPHDMQFRKFVAHNIDGIVSRAETMACKVEREQALQNPSGPRETPVIQSITNLIQHATNPVNFAKSSEYFHPWF